MEINPVVCGYYETLLSYLPYGCLPDRLSIYLFDTPFVSFLKNDENRAQDGLALRYQFLEKLRDEADEADADYFEHWRSEEKDCSMLEMLIAFGIRIENYWTARPGRRFQPETWVIEMLKNCGLLDLDWEDCTDEEADDVLNPVLLRKYRYDGRGGFWPNPGTKKDQRTTDLWYQAAEYLKGRYKI